MFKELFKLAESKITSDGKYLNFPDGSTTSIDSDSAVIMSNKDSDKIKVYSYGSKIILDTGSYDKEFKNISELVSYMNKNKMKYIGIDDV